MLKLNETQYYANLALYGCESCGGEFIVSAEHTERTGGNISCPYCCSKATKLKAESTDENRAEFHLGCFTLVEPPK